MDVQFNLDGMGLGDVLAIAAFGERGQAGTATASDLLAILQVMNRYTATDLLALPPTALEPLLMQFVAAYQARFATQDLTSDADATARRLLGQVRLDKASE